MESWGVGRSILERENSKCKDPEVKRRLAIQKSKRMQIVS